MDGNDISQEIIVLGLFYHDNYIKVANHIYHVRQLFLINAWVDYDGLPLLWFSFHALFLIA